MRGSEGPVAVLAAEDNEINQMVLTGLLEQARPHYAVRIANDGAEALQAWRDGAFDLILMDVRMPGMDGREATQRIRAEEAAGGRRTPIVALTGEAMESEIAACYAAGMDAHVCKPFEIGTLLQAIDKAMAASAVYG
jgi:CheY-like chemotaxis protein